MKTKVVGCAFLLLSTAIWMGASSCVTTPPPPPPPPPPRSSGVGTGCKLPMVTPLPETIEAPEKGGIQISVAPASYAAKVETKIRRTPTAEPFIVWQRPPNSVYMEEVIEHSLKAQPEHLQFLVKINNKLPRVFRGAGTVVQFNVGGKLQAVDQSGYYELITAIVPPRTEIQIPVSGPPLNTLPDKTTVGLFLYDVVTRVDDKGTVAEKQNFEWYFDYATRIAQESVPATRVQKRYVSIGEIQEEQLRLQQDQMRNIPRFNPTIGQ